MTHAVRVHAFGGPEVLKYEEVLLAKPGPGEVQLRQHACGLNYIDSYFRTGLYPVPAMPFILGNEGAGEVIAVGDGVTRFRKGDRVAYTVTLGSYATERNIDQKWLIKLPDTISYDQAAGMMLKGLTAQYLLRRTFKVKPGQTVLIQAAAGGTGTILTQWAKHLGATVIGTVGTPDKAKIAKVNGADHVILYRDEDFVAKVKDITKGERCDVVYDGVGKSTFTGSLDCLKPFGTLVSFGSASGPVEGVNLGILASKGSLYVTRPTLFTHIGDPKVLASMSRDLMKVVADGSVKIPVKQRFALSKVADAQRALEGRETTGSIILTP